MIKHIVFWHLKDRAHGNEKATNVRIIKERVDARVRGATALDTGPDFSQGANSSDLVLYSEFVDRAALAAYRVHPDHQALAEFVLDAQCERQAVDYET
ncbi:stress responsive protein [Variovorax sp. WS11]|uniref:Dabb family protein n=1 Tax=Variovorax sp. WS11 TaxID=1105204 RepID=UPI000D0E0591|nr:Dabb family protein [Variovorax sp. WS11]NDZ17729.1 Dabb family protein [Variovorax sp. WS11]PSL80467.1 stress responsive protein [Variovorax sp. WS11]